MAVGRSSNEGVALVMVPAPVSNMNLHMCYISAISCAYRNPSKGRSPMPIETINPIRKLAIPARYRDTLKLLFIAKHALGDGSRDSIDGDHAVYHREVRDVLEAMGLNVAAANSPEILFTKPDVDFVFSLLNRGGYLNSELMMPLLCTRLGIPYLGASPIVRGLSDDKHLMKMAARARGVPTADSAIFRRFAPIDPISAWSADRYVVKPNASSASWGVSVEADWTSVKNAVAALHGEGHDALVEPFLSGIDVELPVIGGRKAQFLPLMRFDHDTEVLRTYAEKRGFEASEAKLVQETDVAVIASVQDLTARLLPELWPFDYARFEFRLNPATGEIHFLEVNLQCNIWSQRVIGRSAAIAGWTYPELLETILAGSMARQGVITLDDQGW
jgi:D-alanine-D-alanine ligase